MRLETSVRLHAGEERIEREDGPIRRKDGALKFGGGPGGHGSGWQYGFRHGAGYTPTRTLEGFPKTGSNKGPHLGVPPIPKGPGVARMPNPSLGRKAVTGPGMTRPSPSLSNLRSKSEAAEPPETGAYSYNPTEQDKWFDDPGKKVKAYSSDEARDDHGRWVAGEDGGRPNLGTAVRVNTGIAHLPKGTRWVVVSHYKDGGVGAAPEGADPKDRSKHKYFNPSELSPVRSPKNVHPLTKGLIPVKTVVGDLTPEQIRRFKEVARRRAAGELEADFDGEPASTMQHAHLAPIDTFHPPSLVKRGKQDHVPTDDPGETDDKFLDVTKRNSKDTWEERMKLLKRSAPGGLPPQIPARTTAIPMHQGSYLPSAMMSAEKPMLKQRPVNWDKQPRSFTSYGRRGSI